MVEARDTARSAVRWAEPGTGGHDVALSNLIWMEYTEGLGRGPEYHEVTNAAVDRPGSARIAIAAVVASGAPVAERATQLVALAKQRPLGGLMYEESLFTVPFAWLAIEEDDLDRAERLLEAFATVDPGSGTAGVRALDQVVRARNGTALSRGDMLMRFVDPAVHKRLSEIVPAALAEELTYWDARLASMPEDARIHVHADRAR